jgi:transposase
MLDIFSMLSAIDVSYKTVESLNSDKEAFTTLRNLHDLLLKKKRAEKDVDATGDRTGHSLTISKPYKGLAQKWCVE